MRGDGIHVIHHAVDRGDLRVVGAGRGETGRRISRVEEVTLVGQLGVQVPAQVHGAEVRAVDLVQGEEIDVRARRGNVRHAVRAEGHAVDDGPGAGLVDEVGDLAHRVDAGDHVGAMGERDRARAVGQQGLEVHRVQLGRIGVDFPLAHDDALVLQPGPGADVGLVVLVGDDDFVTALQLLPQGLRDDVAVLRCGRPEVQFVRRRHSARPPCAVLAASICSPAVREAGKS